MQTGLQVASAVAKASMVGCARGAACVVRPSDRLLCRMAVGRRGRDRMEISHIFHQNSSDIVRYYHMRPKLVGLLYLNAGRLAL